MYKHANLAAALAAKNVAAQDLTGKNVIIRTCLNVAMDKNCNITDATRINESFPTLKMLGEKANRVVMLAHLGRPTTAREPEFSLEPIRKDLETRLGSCVVMLKNEEEIEATLSKPTQNKYYLVENIRFFKGEESKDADERLNFAKFLAKYGDVYVNDAFADYREAASTYELASLLPAYLGSVFVREISALDKLNNPERPYVAILGGAKLSEKLDTMVALAEQADYVLVGGAMAYNFIKAKGLEIGTSLHEEDKISVAKELLERFGDKIILPIDHVVAKTFSGTEPAENTVDAAIPVGMVAIDIGIKTQELYEGYINKAKTILWNGPMGVFKWASCVAGTKRIGEAIVKNQAAYTFAGGGDSIEAINMFALKGFGHVSTGGGAMLSFVAYATFSTLDVILNKP